MKEQELSLSYLLMAGVHSDLQQIECRRTIKKKERCKNRRLENPKVKHVFVPKLFDLWVFLGIRLKSWKKRRIHETERLRIVERRALRSENLNRSGDLRETQGKTRCVSFLIEVRLSDLFCWVEETKINVLRGSGFDRC